MAFLSWLSWGEVRATPLRGVTSSGRLTRSTWRPWRTIATTSSATEATQWLAEGSRSASRYCRDSNCGYHAAWLRVSRLLKQATKRENTVKAAAIRGLQALSVQFRFAFSKPSSSQTRFLNRTVAAPAEVAHFCRYKKKYYFSANLRFEEWIL